MSMPYDAPSGPGDSGPDEAYRRWRLLQEQADAEHDALLVSDAERDGVCRRLSAAFSEGRITSPELDDRTSRALAARTYGDLEDVMAGLEPPATTSYRPVMPGYPLPRARASFRGSSSGWSDWSPLPSSSSAAPWCSSAVSGHVGLRRGPAPLFLPGLIALYRWAHPRT